VSRRNSSLPSARWLLILLLLPVAGLLLLLAAPASTSAGAPLALEQTLAYRMLKREQAVRTIPASVEPLLQAVLEEGLAALGPDPVPPTTAEEFRVFAESVSIAMAKRNFVQPGKVRDWPDTIGEAFLPVQRGDRRAADALANDAAGRLGHVAATGPLYLVDCDIGSMLIISMAQMAGFEVAMVEVPGHNFLRWQGPSGASASWDWTYWKQRRDSEWRHLHGALLSRKVFLDSQTLQQTEGYFKSVLAAKVDLQPAKLTLRREAASQFPNNRVVAHGVARTFALSSAASARDRKEALGYGLLALSMEGHGDPESIAHRFAVVACAYAGNGDRTLARAFAQRAVEDAGGESERPYRANLEAIEAGRTCPPS
jgi:hypothetical protein